MKTSGWVWFNGKIVPLQKAMLSVMDRGYLYGDGVYEAVRVYAGKIFRADDHWRRLDHSLKSLQIKIPWSHAQLTRACEAVVKKNKLVDAMMRLTISRGSGEMGYDISTVKRPTASIIASGVRGDLGDLWRSGVKVELVKVRRNPIQSLSPRIKHTNAINGILAKMESLQAKAFEGVFLNIDGFVAEGTISNIFFVSGQTVMTPSLDCGILEGVTRRVFLNLAKAAGLKTREGKFLPRELLSADEAFLTSTTMEAMPIVLVGGKKIGSGRPGPVTERLHIAFRKLLRRELDLPQSFELF